MWHDSSLCNEKIQNLYQLPCILLLLESIYVNPMLQPLKRSGEQLYPIIRSRNRHTGPHTGQWLYHKAHHYLLTLQFLCPITIQRALVHFIEWSPFQANAVQCYISSIQTVSTLHVMNICISIPSQQSFVSTWNKSRTLATRNPSDFSPSAERRKILLLNIFLVANQTVANTRCSAEV